MKILCCCTPETHTPGGGTALAVADATAVGPGPSRQLRDELCMLGALDARDMHAVGYSRYTFDALGCRLGPKTGEALGLTHLPIKGPFVAALADGAGEWRGSLKHRFVRSPGRILGAGRSSRPWVCPGRFGVVSSGLGHATKRFVPVAYPSLPYPKRVGLSVWPVAQQDSNQRGISMNTRRNTPRARRTPISPVVADRMARLLAPLRCHLCTVPYGEGTPTDERPFGCTVCLEVRRLVAELRAAAGQAAPRTTGQGARRRGTARRESQDNSTPESGL